MPKVRKPGKKVNKGKKIKEEKGQEKLTKYFKVEPPKEKQKMEKEEEKVKENKEKTRGILDFFGSVSVKNKIKEEKEKEGKIENDEKVKDKGNDKGDEEKKVGVGLKESADLSEIVGVGGLNENNKMEDNNVLHEKDEHGDLKKRVRKRVLGKRNTCDKDGSKSNTLKNNKISLKKVKQNKPKIAENQKKNKSIVNPVIKQNQNKKTTKIKTKISKPRTSQRTSKKNSAKKKNNKQRKKAKAPKVIKEIKKPVIIYNNQSINKNDTTDEPSKAASHNNKNPKTIKATKKAKTTRQRFTPKKRTKKPAKQKKEPSLTPIPIDIPPDPQRKILKLVFHELENFFQKSQKDFISQDELETALKQKGWTHSKEVLESKLQTLSDINKIFIASDTNVIYKL